MVMNGTRSGTGNWPSSNERGETKVTISLRENLHLVSAPENLDASVEEVFGMMLGVSCVKVSDPSFDVDRTLIPGEDSNEGGAETITAVVGFGGLLSGACVFRSSGAAALIIASKLVGMDFAEVDDTVKDAFGEICNMLAGGWKSKVPELASNCGLSVPAVITGSNYRIHVQAPEFKLHQSFSFEDTVFAVTIICDGLH